MKYRKKPVVIEAFQMTEERRRDNRDWPNWLHEAWNKGNSEIGGLYPGNKGNTEIDSLYPEKYPTPDGSERLRIKTLEGDQLVSWGDYIIKGVKGEIYPCRCDIFELTYERV